MQIQTNKAGDAIYMEVSGRMDAAAAPSFEAQCQKFIEDGAKSAVADFETLEYLSSAGLRSILIISKKLKANGGKLVFCNVKGTVKEIFDISGFSSMFEFYTDSEKAFNALR